MGLSRKSSISPQGSEFSGGSSGGPSWTAGRVSSSSMGFDRLTLPESDLLGCDGGFVAPEFRISALSVRSTKASRASNRSRILLPGIFRQIVTGRLMSRWMLTVVPLRNSILQTSSFNQPCHLQELLARITVILGITGSVPSKPCRRLRSRRHLVDMFWRKDGFRGIVFALGK